MQFTYDDGGPAAAGYKGKAGDCVCRAIAIATEQPYQTVYDSLNSYGHTERTGKRKRGRSNARTGVYKGAIVKYLTSLGWRFTPTMGIGTGCTVHLTDGELPMGRLIVSVSRHYCAVINGVIHDTFNPSERGTTLYGPDYPNIPKGARLLDNGQWAYSPARCVYGYWTKP